MIKIVFLIYPLLWLAITLVDTELANFKKYSRKLNGLPKQLVYPFVGRQIVNNIFGGGSGKKFYSFTPVAILALIFWISPDIYRPKQALIALVLVCRYRD